MMFSLSFVAPGRGGGGRGAPYVYGLIKVETVTSNSILLSNF